MQPVHTHFEFVNGPISFELVQGQWEKASAVTGAVNSFLGRVRNDEIQGSEVTGIYYTTYLTLAKNTMTDIFNEACKNFEVQMISVIHSTGLVPVGEISLAVIVGSRHRKASLECTEWVVENIKKRLPVWGKELTLETESWKINT